MIKYLVSVLAGLVTAGLMIAVAFTAAAGLWPEKMPPPAISGSLATDEKLRYLRERGDAPVSLLAVGSSITWKHLDGEPFDARGSRFLNGGTAYLRVHEIRQLAGFYLDLYPGIADVVMASTLPDFENCRGEARVMNMEDARAYVRGERPVAWFYMTHFAPLRYVMQSRRREHQLVPYDAFGYWLDRHGTTPSMLDTRPGYDLRYGEMGLDRACLTALADFAGDLKARGTGFTLVLTPVSPRYAHLYPRTGTDMAEVARFARAAGIRVLDFTADPSYGDADFWDAFHMQWPAAQRLSQEVAETLM